jgi:hypothetical protein
MDEQIATKIDMSHADERVVFYFCNCSLAKKYSFYELGRKNAEDLIVKLKQREKITWRQWSGLPPTNGGLKPEKMGTKSFEMIKEQDSSEQQMAGKRYYFHFDITLKFRVFGYQENNFFCITHIDPNHKIQKG